MLERNKTWEVVHLPKGANVIPCRAVLKIKYGPDGEIEKYKVLLEYLSSELTPLDCVCKVFEVLQGVRGLLMGFSYILVGSFVVPHRLPQCHPAAEANRSSLHPVVCRAHEFFQQVRIVAGGHK